MAELRPSDVKRRRRRWAFAACIFDEANWTLSVDGKRVPIETKPLELLRELLLRAGNVVTKDELLDAVWPDVTVVEASLATAVHKLRLALGDERHGQRLIETVPAIGYRFAVPVEMEELSGAPVGSVAAAPPAAGASAPRKLKNIWLLAVVGLLALAAFVFVAPSQPGERPLAGTTYSQRDQITALRKLDVDAVERMVAAGWDPNLSYDKQGDGAIIMALNICEWDPDHDQRKLLLIVRTLLDAGARLDHRNAFGDTPYSVAKAKRYCGPNHPVTKMIRTLCYGGGFPLGDRCLASYELKKD